MTPAKSRGYPQVYNLNYSFEDNLMLLMVELGIAKDLSEAFNISDRYTIKMF